MFVLYQVWILGKAVPCKENAAICVNLWIGWLAPVSCFISGIGVRHADTLKEEDLFSNWNLGILSFVELAWRAMSTPQLLYTGTI